MKNFLKSRLVASAAIVAVSIAALTGCANVAEMSSLSTLSSQATVDQINQAETIELKKSAISIGDNWTVTADGEKIAEIKGQAFYVAGDTYAMYSNNGDFLGAESENFKILNSTADFYNHKGEVSGKLSQQMLNMLHTFNLKDTEGETVATLKQNFGLSLKGEIKDAEGVESWEFSKSLVSIGASLKIEKLAESDVSAMDAIWMVTAVNEIDEARASKKN